MITSVTSRSIGPPFRASVIAVSGGFLAITLKHYLGLDVPWIFWALLLTAMSVVMMIRGVAVSFLPYLQDFSIDSSTMLLCFQGTLAVGFLSTFVPAWQAIRRPIVDGLRSL